MFPRVLAIGVLLALAAGDGRSEASDEYVRALAALAEPLESREDLGPLIESAGNRRVVLLGEASHGTSEFYAWRAAISRELIGQAGFSFIAVEGDWASLHRLNRYVKGTGSAGSDKSARSILSDLDRWPRWMWANEEIVEIAEWLREFNRDRPEAERVGFYGIDIYDWERSLESVLETAERADAGLHRELERLYAEFRRYAGDPQAYARAAFAFATSAEEDVPAALALLREHRSLLTEKVGDEAYFHAEQNGLVIKNAEAHIRKMADDRVASWNARAGHFKRTTRRLLERYGDGARGIVWAHNTHVGDARATPMHGYGQTNIGELARSRWGRDEVFILGFSTYRGSLLAGRVWGGDRETLALPDARAGSVEAALEATGIDPALVLFADEDRESPLSEVRGHRAIGVVYQPQNEAATYVPTRLPARYDGILFIRETTPLTPLHH